MIYLGADGGATHTRIWMVRDKTLSKIEGDGSSADLLGVDMAIDAVLALSERLLRDASDQEVAAALCLAGLDRPEDLRRASEHLGRRRPKWKAALSNDLKAMLWAGAPEGTAVVLAAGTGANAGWRRADGSFGTLRGKGYEQGNFGGGLDVAREALHAAFRSEEGSGPATALEDRVLALSGEHSFDDLAQVLETQPHRLLPLAAALPPAVFDLAGTGDREARRIVTSAGSSLSGLARAAARKAGLLPDSSFLVVLGGGLFTAGDAAFVDTVTFAVHRGFPRARLVVLDVPPVSGALRLAWGLAHGSAAERAGLEALWSQAVTEAASPPSGHLPHVPDEDRT